MAASLARCTAASLARCASLTTVCATMCCILQCLPHPVVVSVRRYALRLVCGLLMNILLLCILRPVVVNALLLPCGLKLCVVVQHHNRRSA